MCYSALVRQDLKSLESQYGAIVVRDQVDDYLARSAQDPKTFGALQERIYPGSYAPVIFQRDGRRVIELMRYNAYAPSYITDPRRLTTYNARRDNLTSRFWSEAFRRHHGIVILGGFFEWVQVRDLLKAGVVTLDQVNADFQRQSEERRARLEAKGKTYRPTPTEKKDPRLRKTIIRFQPEHSGDLVVPVIFSQGQRPDGSEGYGFAIVTDDPPEEVAAAGHDRCPVILDPAVIDDWLQPEGKSVADLNRILTTRRSVTFQHQLPEVA